MGKSIRSKRQKQLRSLKREKLAPREAILLEQRSAILSTIKGEKVDESAIPQLPEDANAIKRFSHTRDGKPAKIHTLKSRYGHLVNNNTCVTKFNTKEALDERYGAVKQESAASTASASASSSSSSKKASTSRLLPTTTASRRRSGRDRSVKAVNESAADEPQVKQEGDDEDADMDAPSSTTDGDGDIVDLDDVDRDQIRYGEFGKPAHERRGKTMIRSKLRRKRAKSVGKGGFLNWHNMAASS